MGRAVGQGHGCVAIFDPWREEGWVSIVIEQRWRELGTRLDCDCRGGKEGIVQGDVVVDYDIMVNQYPVSGNESEGVQDGSSFKL